MSGRDRRPRTCRVWHCARSGTGDHGLSSIRTDLTARFGPWCVRTPLTNVAELAITGPYAGWKVVGPPHLSFADRGLTFGTGTTRGVCIRFHEPVVGMEPTGRLRHPALTVTLRDPEHLIATMVARTLR